MRVCGFFFYVVILAVDAAVEMIKTMAVTKKIEIDGKMMEFRASAAVPRLYRIKSGRDIYKDLQSLEKKRGRRYQHRRPRPVLNERHIMLDFAYFLNYYTRKEVTRELVTYEYNNWR